MSKWGESMVKSIIQKANARLKLNFLYWKQRYLNLHTKRLLVMSLIQCHFDYACSFWYTGSSQLLQNRLQTTQNKIIRLVLKMGPRSHIGPDVFKSLGWLHVSKRVDQIILSNIYKITRKSGTSPDYMKEQFVPTSSVHSYSTRFRKKRQFFSSKGEKFWKEVFRISGIYFME